MNRVSILMALSVVFLLSSLGVTANSLPGFPVEGICMGVLGDDCTQICDAGYEACVNNCAEGDDECMSECSANRNSCYDICFCIDMCDRELIWCEAGCQTSDNYEDCVAMCSIQRDICFEQNCSPF